MSELKRFTVTNTVTMYSVEIYAENHDQAIDIIEERNEAGDDVWTEIHDSTIATQQEGGSHD